MKTWKKIEETKKRTGDITGLKKRNEEKVQKVSFTFLRLIYTLENLRHSTRERAEKAYVSKQLHDFKVEVRRKKESAGCPPPSEKRGSEISQNDQAIE